MATKKKQPSRKPLEPWQIRDAARLKELFAKRAGKSQLQFAIDNKIGETQGAVEQYLNGRIPLNLSAALKFAEGLGVAVEEFSPTIAQQLRPGAYRRWKSPEPIETEESNVRELHSALKGMVPVISWVQAGDFASVVDNYQPGHADDWAYPVGPVHRHTYGLKVRGPSMTNTSGEEPTFPDGSVIIVEPDLIDVPENLVGKFVIVRRAGDDEATFKRLVKDAGKFYLQPLNPQFQSMELRAGDVICGVVRAKTVSYL